jgi:hypothetical protein
MYQIKKCPCQRGYRDLYVNGIHVLRDKPAVVNAFVNSNVKPLGLEKCRDTSNK